AQICHTLVEQYLLQLMEAADLLNRTGLYLSGHALYTLAEPLFQSALAIYKQQLGNTHPFAANSLNNLAALYQKQGKYGEAESFYHRALVIYEQLDNVYPFAANSLSGLAALY